MTLPFFCGSGGGVHHIADDDGTRHVAGVDLLLLKADPHQVTGEFLIGLVLRHGHMLTQPAHIYIGIFSLPHHELFTETHITLDEIVHIVDVMAQQQRALHAHTESESGIYVRVDAG